MSGRERILSAAKQAVMVDRAATHGDAERSFEQIAGLWSVRLGFEITPAQVAIMMIDLKSVRAWFNPQHEDNWIDQAGYAACGGELAAAARAAVAEEDPAFDFPVVRSPPGSAPAEFVRGRVDG